MNNPSSYTSAGTGVFASVIIALLRVYQKTLAPLTGNCCRFYPSCSGYMIDSLRKYGLFTGIFKGVKRVCKCHPWHPGGVDLP